jgi:uncharacterized small protein (DUF1192 family)
MPDTRREQTNPPAREPSAPQPPDTESVTARQEWEAQQPPDERAQARKPQTLWVVSNRNDDSVVIWDANPANQHPGGEAFIGGRGVAVEVAKTPQIEKLLSDRQLRHAQPHEVDRAMQRRVEFEAAAAGQPMKSPAELSATIARLEAELARNKGQEERRQQARAQAEQQQREANTEQAASR